ncbi:helix-turn-helix domain-containing protein, partial [Thiolinea disciformis]|uniref:helix-turn-helix domain-containing protein n=2 Tax=Thiolinea disciformis TaxID=125614 RepID=UPI0003817E45
MGVYGLELRERVLAAYERHQNKSLVCREFQIARTTLDDWIRWQAEGRLKPEVWSRGRRHTIQDWDAFKRFVEQASFT